jgi:predicted MFS family arabinose efflux permease
MSLENKSALLRVISSQSASTYANQVIAFVIPWLVLTRTGSAVNAGAVAFAMGAAALAGTLAGGLITDRIGGRKVSMIADALSLMTALVLAITLFFDFFSLWLVIVSQVLGVFFDGPGTIAKNTMLPAAAQQDDVPMVRAMGLQQTLQNMAMFIGPVSAGFFIAALNESVTLAVSSLLFLASLYLVASSQRQAMLPGNPMTVRQAYADLREAVSFLVREPFLGPMQVYGPLYAFILLPVGAIVFPAWFVFAGQGAGALGVFLGAQALGGIVGGFAFAALAPKVSQQKWLVGASAAYSLALFGLYFLQPGSTPAVVVGFLAGLAITGIMAIPYTAFILEPAKILGRVNSLGAAAGYLVSALAALFFGWLVNATSANTGILVCATGMGVLAFGSLLLPFMKQLDEKQEPVIVEDRLKNRAGETV